MLRCHWFAIFFLLVLPPALAQKTFVEDYRIGEFVSASSIDVDPFDHIYVTDRDASMVYKYDMKGNKLAEIGGPGWGNTEFDQPSGIDASLGVAVYVADYGNNRIQRFDKELNFLGSFEGDIPSAVSAQFAYPVDVVVSPLGDLFILDEENRRGLYTSGFANVEFIFGGIDAGAGALTSPVAIDIGSENQVFVLEPNRIIEFDVFGEYQKIFAEGKLSLGQGIRAIGKSIFVVTPVELYLYTVSGELRSTWKKENFVFASDPGEFRDIAVHKDRLLLLCERSIIVLPLQKK
ncbi:MAG: hypothetical protein CL946_00285 [Ectothiorhodospiraceae bacterium]|nr:hypothetical protein [Ectothiorhodospiraceae bacterium]